MMNQRVLLIIFVCILLAPASGVAQNGQLPGLPEIPPDARTAQSLYEEANGYLDRKFAEFNKQKLAYDPKLDATTKQGQKDLAARNAGVLEAREHDKTARVGDRVAETDLYYLGMLHHLAGNSDAALKAMRRFIAASPPETSPR